MLVYWKKYEKVEKEHRKKAEKEAIEQRKIDFEMNEVNTERHKGTFLWQKTFYISAQLTLNGVCCHAVSTKSLFLCIHH